MVCVTRFASAFDFVWYHRLFCIYTLTSPFGYCGTCEKHTTGGMKAEACGLYRGTADMVDSSRGSNAAFRHPQQQPACFASTSAERILQAPSRNSTNDGQNKLCHSTDDHHTNFCEPCLSKKLVQESHIIVLLLNENACKELPS